MIKINEWNLTERNRLNGWIGFKLVAPWPAKGGRNARKANFWFGWNGERMSQNRDVRLLAEHHPEIHSSLLMKLQGIRL